MVRKGEEDSKETTFRCNTHTISLPYFLSLCIILPADDERRSSDHNTLTISQFLAGALRSGGIYTLPPQTIALQSDEWVIHYPVMIIGTTDEVSTDS